MAMAVAKMSATIKRVSVLYILVFGICFLCEIEKCFAAIGETRITQATNTTTTTTTSATRYHDGRILQSVNANAGEFPFFAQWGGCGATLIWEDILLTSATCNVVSDENVLVGAHTSHLKEGDSVWRKIVSREIHQEFDEDSLANNFMLLKLGEKVDSLPHVWIDPTTSIDSDSELYVVGFGFTAPLLQVQQIYSRTFHHTLLDTSSQLQAGLQGSVLQKAKLSLVSHAVCNAYDQYAGFIDKDSMICTNDDDDACLGDNGGPLCMMVNNECVQIGVVSFGESCMMGNRPTVFSSITPVHGWIEKNVCALSSNPPPTCRASVKSKDPVLSRNNRPLNKPVSIESTDPFMPSASPSIAQFFVLPDDPPFEPRTIAQFIEFPDDSSFKPRTRPSSSQREFPSPSSAPSEVPSREDDWEDDIVTNTTWDEDYASATVVDDDYAFNLTWDDDYTSNTTDNRNLEESFFHIKDEPIGIFRLPKEPSVSIYPNDFFTDEEPDERTESAEGTSDSLRFEVTEAVPFLSSKKLGECEGDCDSDDDCEEGLYCFFKDGDITSVPGCSGSDTSRTDYCTKRTEDSPTFSRPLPMLFVFPENPPDISNLPLQRCQGDCDSDSDCAEGLICYQRPPGRTTIPGCSGYSTTRTDFCVDLNWRNAPAEKSPDVSITAKPTPLPTVAPVSLPLRVITSSPTATSSFAPSEAPTFENQITQHPTALPTPFPTILRTPPPTPMPTGNPQTNIPTRHPTFFPTKTRTAPPTNVPTLFPTKPQTDPPTNAPTFFPTKPRTDPPTNSPTFFPTKPQIDAAAIAPSYFSTEPRTDPPTMIPTNMPTVSTIAPSPQQTTLAEQSANEVSVTFAIYFDPWPQEVSWMIESENATEGIVASVPTGAYQSPQDKALEVLTLKNGGNYVLTIQDSSNDGIAGIGTIYEIYLTDHPDIVLLDGNGIFEASRSEVFHVPTLEEYPPSSPMAPTVSPAPAVPTSKVYLVIVFDNWHQETAWVITDEGNPTKVLAEATYDTYRSGETVTEEIMLPSGGVYTFTIRDFFNDGIKGGEYLLTTSDGQIIFAGDGNFGSSRSHTFTLPAE